MFNIPTVAVANAKRTLTGTASSVTLTYVAPSVAWTPRHLLVRVNATNGTAADDVLLQFNGDTGSNYNRQYLLGNGTNELAGRDTSTTFINTMAYPGGTDDVFGGGEILIPDALSTRSHKTTISMAGAAESLMLSCAGRWASTAAITSVTLTANTQTFAAGSTFELCVVDESYNFDEQIKTVGTGAGTFTVSSIPADVGDLVCIGNWRSDRALINRDTVEFEFNSDATDANYGRQNLSGGGASAAGGANADRTLTGLPASTADTSVFGGMVAQITNYSAGSNDRMMTTLGGAHHASSDSTVQVGLERWNNTAAITSVDFNPVAGTNFIIGSMLSTYSVPKNLIARQELDSNTTTVTFSSIPQTYDHLELSVYARGTSPSVPTRAYALSMNSDTTDANYPQQVFYAQGSSPLAYQADSRNLTSIPSGTATANVFGTATTTIYNYTKTDRHKHYLTVGGMESSNVAIVSSQWENTAAVTTIAVTVNVDQYLAGSVFVLSGINAPAAATPSDIAELNGIAPADIEAVN